MKSNRRRAPDRATGPHDLAAHPAARHDIARSSRRWLAVLVVGVIAIAGYYALPRGGVAQPVLLCSVNATAAVTAFVAAAHARRQSRLVWYALAAAMTLSTLAQIPNYGYPLLTGLPIPFPSPLDAVWLGTYPCFVVALWALAKHNRTDESTGRLLDAAILITGGGTLMWVCLVSPALNMPGLRPFAHYTSVLFPVMDVIVFSMLVRLVVGSQRNAAMRLLMASFVTLLVSDSLYALELARGSYRVGGPNDALWMLSYLLIAVAALHPTSVSFPQASVIGGHRLTSARLLFLGAAVLVGPVVLLVGPAHDVVAVVCSSIASFLLVMARMAWLNRTLAATSSVVQSKTAELRHLALHDPLTGLANRALVMDRLHHLLARGGRGGADVVVLYADLDGFKNINDTLGHGAGDALLRAVADRLTDHLRDADTVARLGGDEFVILLDGAAPATWAVIAERLLDAVRQPYEIAGALTLVTMSIGIAGGRDTTPSELLHDADLALYEAKAAGKNCFEIYRPELCTDVQRHDALEFDLRVALEAGQYRVVYQPIYDLTDLTLTGVEALLRWQHPTLGRIQPDEFIPLLEASGQIIDVGRWVLREACNQTARWRDGGSNLTVAVNVSARQLDRASFLDHVTEALQTSGLTPAALTLEITETALMRNIDVTADRLHGLKAIGVQLAVDDFGTGYSSLAYLERFSVDCLKIDRAFTDSIGSSRESNALIHTLIQLGKDLALKTLAEGVETTEQLDHLRTEGVDMIQGFLLARPVEPQTLENDYLNLIRPTGNIDAASCDPNIGPSAFAPCA